MDIENKSRRQLQSEQTKDRLFHAAMELLAERNFDDITIRDIVARAEVSIGTFYNYYSTKMEVFMRRTALPTTILPKRWPPCSLRERSWNGSCRFSTTTPTTPATSQTSG